VAAAIGIAVGTGNMWRFPWVAAEWGGGSFLIALKIANLMWAIPSLWPSHSWDRRAGWVPWALSGILWTGSGEYAA
jgi:SNF family Na+-dependent transporter